MTRRFSLLVPVLILFCSILAPSPAFSANLEKQISSYINSLRSSGVLRADETTAWIVYDLSDESEIVAINGAVPLQAASMIKTFIALAFFYQMEAGKVIYGPEARRHMQLMIQKSNNESTNWVMRQVGGPEGTMAILKQYFPYLCEKVNIVEYIPDGGKTYKNQASGRDYAKFLHALWNRNLPQSEEMLRLMGLPGTNRLYTKVNSIPEGTRLYNKTGSTAMCCGDMGILVPNGRDGKTYPYVVVGIIQSSQRNNANYSTWITKRADMIREVSGIVYREMKSRHPL